MSAGEVNVLMRGAVVQILQMILPVLGLALIVGLIVAIFQAATSIQEQTLTFLPKFVVIILVIALLGGVAFTSLGQYTVLLFNRIPDFAK
ncbi:flagellar biosynthetic protein FliQ [Treponema sp. JC4]|jgi:flagellar biosynthetic protein FliQ|uniref:flagellar biosynthesis protein FliQ n=1 Tax=unclassified Treponema TaxID=2638727 RepID=UPI00025B0ACE|nr:MULTISPECIES: flagellar biosynthesis protein FliQ [unclassified Treponema]EID84648.1 flagellar biosynthetic protein FliQ [Treponema sp. JC4]